MARKTAIFSLLLGSLFVGINAIAEIHPDLMKRFLPGMGGGEAQNVMVSFTQSMDPIFQQINAQNFSSDAEKRTALTSLQQTFTQSVQSGLQNVLKPMGVQSESFWINNKMIVQNADPTIVNIISQVPGVAKIEPEPKVNLLPVNQGEPWEEASLTEMNMNKTRFARQTSGATWGVRKIRADQVWNNYNLDGWGVVVANIDTGVRWTHVLLKDRWRQSYGWYDPYSRTSQPNDQNGHGTHTMGTISGSQGYGVAKLATWIACKGCNSDSCGGTQLFQCGQWIQCPTDPAGGNKDCSKAPHIVSNSWGGGGGSTWYDDVIKSWKTSGIIPVFSNGNSGPNCNTVGTPGDRPSVIGVGSTESDDSISSFSSLGPANDGTIKPDISAPGGQVQSAWYTGDRALNTISGTSMACPHVAGVIAMMKEKRPSLTYDMAYSGITRNPVRPSTSVKTCGNRGGSTYPNNVFGYGRIDALNSVNAV